jgi:hypothetical protein
VVVDHDTGDRPLGERLVLRVDARTKANLAIVHIHLPGTDKECEVHMAEEGCDDRPSFRRDVAEAHRIIDEHAFALLGLRIVLPPRLRPMEVTSMAVGCSMRRHGQR